MVPQEGREIGTGIFRIQDSRVILTADKHPQLFELFWYRRDAIPRDSPLRLHVVPFEWTDRE